MRSVSNGYLNQEVPLVREYAKTPGLLVAKQMQFTKSIGLKVAQLVIDATDEMSADYQKRGLAELTAQIEELGKVN